MVGETSLRRSEMGVLLAVVLGYVIVRRKFVVSLVCGYRVLVGGILLEIVFHVLARVLPTTIDRGSFYSFSNRFTRGA